MPRHVGSQSEFVEAVDTHTGSPALLWRLVDARANVALEHSFLRRAEEWLHEFDPTGFRVIEIGRLAGRVGAICEWMAGSTLAERLAAREPLDTPRLVALGQAAIAQRRRSLRDAASGAPLDPRDILIGTEGRIVFFGIPEATLEPAEPTARGSAHATWLKRSDHDRRDREATAVGEIATLMVHACGPDAARIPTWLSLVFQGTTGAERRIATFDGLARALAEAKDHLPPPAVPEPASDSTTDDSESSSLSGDVAAFPYRALDRRYVPDGDAQRGGMSELQRAYDLETRRSVAVKRLRPQRRGNPRAERRFRREARSMAALDHPHVLKLVDMGCDQDGDYMVCEWADGGSLFDRVMAQGPLDRNAALAIVRKIGSALEHAHARGQIHRDVKPHNILLMADGEPKLGDFGLVLTEAEPEERIPGARPGTPNYMAPEQGARGGDVDERADLYAFAKTILFLFSRQKPNPADVALAPYEFRGPLRRALSDRPEDRHPSIRAFQRDIERRRWMLRSGQALAAIGIPSAIVVALALRFGRVDERPVDAATEMGAPTNERAPLSPELASDPGVALEEEPARTEALARRPAADTDDPLASAKARLAEARSRLGDPKVALRALAARRPEIDGDPRTARLFAALDEARTAIDTASRLEASGDLDDAAQRLADALARYLELEALLTALGAD